MFVIDICMYNHPYWRTPFAIEGCSLVLIFNRLQTFLNNHIRTLVVIGVYFKWKTSATADHDLRGANNLTITHPSNMDWHHLNGITRQPPLQADQRQTFTLWLLTLRCARSLREVEIWEITAIRKLFALRLDLSRLWWLGLRAGRLFHRKDSCKYPFYGGVLL